MVQMDIQQVQADLLRCLEQIAPGEIIVVYKGSAPIAEFRRLPSPPSGERPLGLGQGTGQIHPSFYEPLPADILDAFEGNDR